MTTSAWKTAVSGNWSQASDWTNGTVPGAADQVVIGGSAPYTVTVSAVEAADSVVLDNGSAVLALDAALSVAGSFSLELGTLELQTNMTLGRAFADTQGIVTLQTGRLLTLTGAVSFGTGSYIAGATVNGTGTLLTKGATTVAQSFNNGLGQYPAQLILGGGATWENTGTVTDAGNILLGDAAGLGAAIVNQEYASFAITTDYNIVEAAGAADTFKNSGALAKIGGSGVSDIYASVMNTSTGRIAASSGTLRFDGGGSFGGTLSGSVAFDGGTSTLTGTTTGINIAAEGGMLAIDAATIGGTITATSGTIAVVVNTSVTGTFSDTQGLVTLGGGQTLTLDAQANFGIGSDVAGATINGTGTVLTKGATTVAQSFENGNGQYPAQLILGGGAIWENTGTVTDTGNILMGDAVGLSATIVNQIGSTFDFAADFGIVNAAGGTSIFANAGTLAKTGGTAISDVAAAVTNTGTILATTGAISFNGGGSFGGTMSGLLAFGGGTSTLTGTVNAGLTVDGGYVTIDTKVNGSIGETAGSVIVNSNASVTGAIALQGGSIALAGGSLTATDGIVLSGTGTLTGNGSVTASVTDDGTISASGSGKLSISGSVGGTGSLSVGLGATLSVGGSVNIGAIDFSAAGTLDLGSGFSVKGQISGFGGSDKIDMLKLSFSGFSFLSGSLTLNGSGNLTATLTFSGSYGKANFSIGSDGSGGTTISFTPTASSVADLVPNVVQHATPVLADPPPATLGASLPAPTTASASDLIVSHAHAAA